MLKAENAGGKRTIDRRSFERRMNDVAALAADIEVERAGLMDVAQPVERYEIDWYALMRERNARGIAVADLERADPRREGVVMGD